MATSQYSHPLANSKLGKLQAHKVYNANYRTPNEPADWRTVFWYDNGEVVMSVKDNSYKYETTMLHGLISGEPV